MDEREPVMEKRVIRLPDGRRLVFYEFPETPPRRPDAPAPPGAAEPAGGEER